VYFYIIYYFNLILILVNGKDKQRVSREHLNAIEATLKLFNFFRIIAGHQRTYKEFAIIL